MSVSQAAGSPYNADATNLTTLSVTPVAVGNLMLLGASINNSTIRIVSISGGGVARWSPILKAQDGTTFLDIELWSGSVTSTGTQNITVTYSGTPGAVCELVATELHASAGKTFWNVVGSNFVAQDTNSTTVNFPSVHSSVSTSQAYWGYAVCLGVASAGSTSGFTYNITSENNALAFNGSPTTNATIQPTCTQSPTDTYDSIGVIVQASVYAPGLITMQATERASYW